jgi:hypothetical protein
MGIAGVVSIGGASKQYMRDAAVWVQDHTGPTSRITTTFSKRFCYYVNREVPVDQKRICTQISRPTEKIGSEYLVVYAKRGALPSVWSEFLDHSEFVEMSRFENRRRDGAVIYRAEGPK